MGLPIAVPAGKKKYEHITQTKQTEFKRKQLINFSIDIRNKYEQVSDKTNEFLLLFTSNDMVNKASSS